MNSIKDNDADSIRTKVCNGNVIFMRQKFGNLELPHSIPFITEYFPTTSQYTGNPHNLLNFYSGLRSVGDRMLEEPTSLGERIIIRCQIFNLSEPQYNAFTSRLVEQIVVLKKLNESNITTVHDYDEYVRDNTLRANYEVGGGAVKQKSKKTKKTKKTKKNTT